MVTRYLDYPLDVESILRKRSQIKRELLGRDPQQRIPVKIAILSGSTVGDIKSTLELFLLREQLEPEFYESQFDRYYEESVFDNERLTDFHPAVAYVHTTVRNLTTYPEASDTEADVEAKLNHEISRFRRMWTELRSRYGCLIIQNNFELPNHRFLGNLDFSDPRGKTNFVMRLNLMFAEYARENRSFFFVNDINYLSARLGLETWFNHNLWYHYRYALSYDAIPYLTQSIASIIRSIYGKSKKCLVLDLDNTLWKGVIGDDGVEGIRMGEGDGVGEAYMDFQLYVKQLKSRGVLLTACSKNDEEIARQAFGHPDAVLKLDDFDFFKANWNPKHGNIVETAEELNIGLDSLVFVDDNPAEREIVRKNLPEVTVPEIGDEVSRYIEYIDRAAYFEPTELSAEDIKRSAMYSANSQRKRLESSFEDYEDYLRTLEMRAEIDRFPSVFMERITQLVNKTNQFNLTTRRYTRPELDSLRNSEDHVTLYGRLDDKFGTNGLVTVIIGEVLGQSLSITLWVMSCRVFGRNMEFAMFDALRHECRERDLTEILGHYYPTKRNGLVADLYGRLGFELVEQKDSGDSSWRYRIPDDYHPMNYVIECS